LTPLLSEIGLPLDLIGAAMLAFGLFRPSRASYPGWVRSPWDASQDQAFGVVGFVFLAVGFTLQALSNLGIGKVQETATADMAPVIVLFAGTLLAYALYGLVYIWRFPREYARAREDAPPVHRRREGLRFWAYAPGADAGSSGP
jgi:hypothetical protein